MLKVAFCDDDLEVLRELCDLMEQYRVDRNREVSYAAFQSPLELLAEIERGARYDILFLDILMCGENGMEAAKEIRRYDGNIKIIFLTSAPEFAVQSYQVNAYFYQLKPIRKEAFYKLLDQLSDEQIQEQSDFLVLKCKTGITRIRLSRLEYCEAINRTLFLHLTNGRELEASATIEQMQSRLAQRSGFLRPHRSYLVNMEHIQNISARAITMNCMAEIPIPHGKYTQIRDAYLDYLFLSGQMIP